MSLYALLSYLLYPLILLTNIHQDYRWCRWNRFRGCTGVSQCVHNKFSSFFNLQEAKKQADQGSKVTSHDIRQHDSYHSSMFTVNGDISDEVQIKSCIEAAIEHHGPINVLIANAGITDESASYPIWQMPLDLWQKTYDNNVRGTFLTIKAFLQSVERLQDEQGGKELENIAIVVTGSETGKFGQAGHSEYASGKAGLQYGFVRGVKNEIVRLNSKGIFLLQKSHRYPIS